MDCKDLLVSVQIGRSNRQILQIAAGLAQRLDCGIVAVGACRPIQAVCGDYSVPAQLFEADRLQTARQMQAAQAEIMDLLSGKAVRLEWRPRCSLRHIAEMVSHEAGSTDLIMVGQEHAGNVLDSTRRIDLADLVMGAGRPVLVVPDGTVELPLQSAMIGWRDTREARRAMADALPLLKSAQRVALVAVGTPAELADLRGDLAPVAAWLGHHGVVAEVVVSAAEATHAAALASLADERKCDLFVAGVHGHLRERDWVLGGVTADLLQHPRRCALLSH